MRTCRRATTGQNVSKSDKASSARSRLIVASAMTCAAEQSRTCWKTPVRRILGRASIEDRTPAVRSIATEAPGSGTPCCRLRLGGVVGQVLSQDQIRQSAERSGSTTPAPHRVAVGVLASHVHVPVDNLTKGGLVLSWRVVSSGIVLVRLGCRTSSYVPSGT